MHTPARTFALFALLSFGLPHAETLRVAAAAPPAAADAAAPAPPPPLADTPRNRVAAHFAPTIFQETRDQRDLLAAFDFDGDWDGSNNAAHVADAVRYPMRAVVYFTVAETETHFLVTYVLYHAVDAKSLSGHDHDSEHVTVVVRKDGSEFGRLEAMETRFHKVLYQYAASRPDGAGVRNGADDIDGPIHLGDDGRPEVYSQRVGHGICGGFAPLSFIDSLALTCHHREAPHIARGGVVYHYRDRAEVPRSLDDRDVGYALAEIGGSLWAHARERGPHATFASLFDFHGERCTLFHCPHGIGELLTAGPGRFSTGMPWEESSGRGGRGRGAAFFDPALTLSRRLAFAPPFSTTYVHNPYLGIGRFDDDGGHGGESTLAREREGQAPAVDRAATPSGRSPAARRPAAARGPGRRGRRAPLAR